MTVYEIITNKIIEAMDKNIIPWQSRWVDKHLNFVGGNAYKGVNTLLLTMDMVMNDYTYPLWLTFNQCKKKGYKIKKGSKTHTVIYFSKFIAHKKDDNGDDIEKVVPVLRYYRVFNIEAVEGYEDIVKKHLKNYQQDNTNTDTNINDAINKLYTYIENEGIKFERQGIDAFYAPKRDLIRMPAQEMDKKDYFLTLAHECAHSTGNSIRLNRLKTEWQERTKENYSFEELVAEISSNFLAAHFNVDLDDGNIDNTVAYLSGWIAYLKNQNNKRIIVSAAKKAEQASEYIIDKINTDSKNLKSKEA